MNVQELNDFKSRIEGAVESLARVTAIVGHSQIKTTNLYLRKAGIEVKGGTDKLGYKLPEDHCWAEILSLVHGNASQ